MPTTFAPLLIISEHSAALSMASRVKMRLPDVVDISTEEADLEEVFLTYYHDDQVNGTNHGATRQDAST